MADVLKINFKISALFYKNKYNYRITRVLYCPKCMRTYMMIADHCFGSELKDFKARKNEHKMNKKKTNKKFREKL